MTTPRRLLWLAMMMVTPVLIAATATADEVVAEIDWSTNAPLSGTVVDGAVLLDEPAAGVYPLAVLDSPPLQGGDIALAVDVVVGDVGSPGYLELWAVYDDGSRYFSRTFDNAGIGLLQTGVSTTMVLPFGLSGTVPDALELNVVLPDGGRLEVGAVTLTEIRAGAAGGATDDDGAWWTPMASGIVGGTAGGLLGVLGALVGVLASRRKARRFVTGILVGGFGLGAVAVVTGLVALGTGQPYHVWFPLLLLGSILASVFGANGRTVAARYEAMELQKIRAYDVS